MKTSLRMLVFLPVIVVIALLSAIVGMVAVAVAFVAVSTLLQLLGGLFGLVWGSPPWHIVTFSQDGRFVFEMTESAYSAMNLLARWVGLVGGGAYGVFLFIRRQRKKGSLIA
jgi:hypothetical protein